MLHRRLVQIILLCGVAIIAATMVVSWSELVEQGRQVLQVLHTSKPLLDRLDRVVDPCPALLPSFTFPIPVDHRRFHGKRNSSQPCRFVVVTTVTGAYDKVDLSFPQTSGPNLCFFIFFDEASARASVPEAELENACFLSKSTEVSSCVLPRLGEWHVVILSDSMISSIPPPFARTRRSRLMKMLSHRAFSSAEFLLYVDGKLIINDVTPETVEAFVLRALRPPGGRVAWASPLHPERQTIYEEALQVCVYNLTDDTGVDRMLSYHAKGYPLQAPPYLIEGTWHYRDLRAPESSLIGCAWMKEFLSWNATRDQLTFNFAVWEANLSFYAVHQRPGLFHGSGGHSGGRETIAKPRRCAELVPLVDPRCGGVGQRRCCSSCDHLFGRQPTQLDWQWLV
ncbi:unnamed protein product [Symbiodinium necroappetens]|uniref:TOD1/MUCI70 glycosyltransferase-like domain-containing protein n=1 Tax=Symbiodinium necroappetens TaxID=1628268 RepID=A0A813CFF7_9DINO|nr:unnamed protein product [Symbiodinium necroappetens]